MALTAGAAGVWGRSFFLYCSIGCSVIVNAVKNLLPILFLILFSCNSHEQREVSNDNDTIIETKPAENKIETPKIYSNERFNDVKVERLGSDSFLIKGKAQIFEANFGWVIEDGHNELQQGHQMTDAGAPEWGNFNFIVHAQKKNPNSTLHLILFESSAKDGSRQYELPILLY